MKPTKIIEMYQSIVENNHEQFMKDIYDMFDRKKSEGHNVELNLEIGDSFGCRIIKATFTIITKEFIHSSWM